jgi:hypothetical protein
MRAKGMHRVIGREGVIAFALALMGLISCDKDALNGAGGKVTVNFTLSDLAYGEEETVTRGAGLQRMEPETVMETLEGTLKMYATLEEEEEAPLRGLETITPGTKVRIVAYDSGGSYVDDNEYTVGSGGGLMSTSPSAGLELPGTDTYRFVAYSLNTTSTLGYAATMGPYSVGSDDLLWGEANESIVDEGMYDITIPMYHQFSRVSLEATSTDLGSYTISAISAAVLGCKAGLTVQSGPTKGAAEQQAFTRTTTLPASTVAFAQRVAYTGGDAITSVLVSTVTINGTTQVNRIARFNRKLEPGKSYKLKISFKKLEWARSNIYWDGSRLTFIPANGVTTNQGYQGVFFKFGSLVGVSPAQVYIPAGSQYINYYDGYAVPIYVPSGYPSAPKWSATTSTASGYTTWGNNTNNDTDIPYLDPTNYAGSVFGRTSTYAIDAERNTTEMYQSLRGDICQYLSTATKVVAGNYRLPVSYEFGSTGDWTFGGTVVNDGSLGHSSGIINLLSATNDRPWAMCSAMGNVTLPAGGMRQMGNLCFVGATGSYWSGSAGEYIYSNHAANAYRLTLIGQNNGDHVVQTDRSVERYYGMPIRCVKN